VVVSANFAQHAGVTVTPNAAAQAFLDGARALCDTLRARIAGQG